MTGPKTNEGATKLDERTGTRAQARYVRSSAYKAREVLNLVRGLEVKRADEVLQFIEREIAGTVRKVLASAVANAEHNDEQDPEELYVRACYADEGPTLKRFRPRARGRASRIRKRTCHITVVVDRMTDEQLARRQAKESAQAQTGGRRAAPSAATSRRARVERSRQAATQRGTEAPPASGSSAEEIVETVAVEAPHGPGSAAPTESGEAPEGYDIKGNADSMLYHVPGSRYYKQTVAEVWFATEADAEAAGFSKPGSQVDDSDEAESTEEA
jgi:large subunit ribosomal protein L22